MLTLSYVSAIVLRPRSLCLVCCAVVYLFPSRYPHLGLQAVTRFSSPLIGVASVEVQVSNQEKLFLHLVPDWSAPAPLHLIFTCTTHKSCAIESAERRGKTTSGYGCSLPPAASFETVTALFLRSFRYLALCLIAVWLWLFSTVERGQGF